LEAFEVSSAAAGFEHADEVDARGDLGADAAAEVLAVLPDAEVVVAARAPRGRRSYLRNQIYDEQAGSADEVRDGPLTGTTKQASAIILCHNGRGLVQKPSVLIS
jgi:hypothetical protein